MWRTPVAVCAELVRRGAQIPIDVLESIVRFLRRYGDRYHRQAEATLLSLLHERGVPAGTCPIVVISYENQKRKTLVDQLSSAVNAYIQSGGVADGALISTLDALAEFFPDHLSKEDYLLLPTAAKVLRKDDRRTMGRWMHLVESPKGAAPRDAPDLCGAAIRNGVESISQSEQANVA